MSGYPGAATGQIRCLFGVTGPDTLISSSKLAALYELPISDYARAGGAVELGHELAVGGSCRVEFVVAVCELAVLLCGVLLKLGDSPL